MKRRTKIVLILFLGALLILAMALAFVGIRAYKTFYYVGSREEKPQLYVVPIPLIFTPCKVGQTTSRSYSDLAVTFPWTGIVEENQYEKFNRLRFDSGLDVLLGKIDETYGPIAMFREQDADTRRGLEAKLGQEATASQYGFCNAMLNTTPDDISLGTHPGKVMGLRMILLLKEIMLPTGETKLYSFTTDSVKGFQIGGGSRRPVEILAFDSPNSGLAVTIILPTDSPLQISQEELNCIIQSIHPASDHPDK